MKPVIRPAAVCVCACAPRCPQFGSIRESGARELTGSGNLFEQGKSDVFKFKMPDLGECVGCGASIQQLPRHQLHDLV